MPEWPCLLRTIMLAIYATAGVPAQATSVLPCEEAAQRASVQTGVPLPILQAVSLAETGQSKFDKARFSPWPWAVQSGAKGNWFPDSRSAIAHVERLMVQGVSNIDIGCFQLNMRWHAEAFQSLEDMFSPRKNALYAAKFLRRLYRQTGDWRAAVGRYHSRDAKRAEAYLQRLETLFDTYLSLTTDTPLPPQPTNAASAVPTPRKFGLVRARGPLIQSRTGSRPIIGGSP